MTAITSYTPSSLGICIDFLSNALSLPSNLVTGTTPKVRLFTTKYLFVQHYIDSPKEAKRILTKLSDEASARNWHLVRRVIWAATIVLPILDTLGALFHQLARLDYALRVRYDDEAKSEQHKALKLEQKAVKKSIREFAGFLLAVSGREKNSSYQGALERTADEQYIRFCSHFARSDPKEVLCAACRSIINLLDRCYPQKNRETEALYNAFQEILFQNDSCEWMKGDPQTNAFQTIINNYELFYNAS